MARTETRAEHSRTFALLSACLVVAALYFCREVLLPLALAILFSFLLAPLVDRLERWRMHRIVAVILAVTLCFVSVGGLSYVLSRQLYDLAYNLPEYKENIIAKARAFRGGEDGVVARATKALKEVQANVLSGESSENSQGPRQSLGKKPAVRPEDSARNGRSPGVVPNDALGTPQEPMQVEVVERVSANSILEAIVGPAFSVLGQAALVVVFVVFMLLDRENLRDRMIHLAGSRQLNVTTQALGDASGRVSRYLVMQLLINSLYGLVITLGLYFIGLPNALLWGGLTALLRFVPYIGPWIAAVMPVAVSLAVFDGWMRPGLIIALFVVNELISNNVFEPWLYGQSTGISSIGILVSAVFWAWLWGPVGLVMATPLTVCLIVLGRYVPEMNFIRTLLSSQEIFPEPTRFYQRLLAQDPEEAMEIAEDFLEKHTLDELYDDVLMPALSLAEQDRHRGELDDETVQFMYTTMREMIEDFGMREPADADDVANTLAEKKQPGSPVSLAKTSILCVPARDEADEIAGLMLSQLTDRRGLTVHVLSFTTLASESIAKINELSANVVCVSALPPHAAIHARYLCKRLRPKLPGLKLVVGLWASGGATKKSQSRLAEIGVDKFVASLKDAAEYLEALASQAVVMQESSNALEGPTVRTTVPSGKQPVEAK